MSEVLHVEQRTLLGKRNNQRLRKSGRLPAVLYGHGEQPTSLSVPADEFHATLRHGARVVDLKGAVEGQALLQDVQWDTFFQHVLHVDFLRVVAGEKVTVTVPVETRGEAPGSREGGLVEQLVHEVEVEVTPADVPDKLHLNINHLELGGELKVSDIEDLPPGARVLADNETVLVHCVARAELVEEELVGGEVEPEVIGQKAREDEEEAGEE
jgi:large subunit ribosomal protein L25